MEGKIWQANNVQFVEHGIFRAINALSVKRKKELMQKLQLIKKLKKKRTREFNMNANAKKKDTHVNKYTTTV